MHCTLYSVQRTNVVGTFYSNPKRENMFQTMSNQIKEITKETIKNLLILKWIAKSFTQTLSPLESRDGQSTRHDLAERTNDMNMVDSAKMLVWIGRCDRTTARWRWYGQSRTNSKLDITIVHNLTRATYAWAYPEAIIERSSNNNDSNDIHQQTSTIRKQVILTIMWYL